MTTTHDEAWLTEREVAARLRICTKTLRRWTEKAPPGLPGEPVNFGSKRALLRWPAAGVDAWAAAVQAASRPARQPAPRQPPPRERRPAPPPPRLVRPDGPKPQTLNQRVLARTKSKE